MGHTEALKPAQRFLTGHRTYTSRTEFPIWAHPSERAVHLRRVGHCQQLGWFDSSKISPTSAKDTQAVGTGAPLSTHQAMGVKGSSG